MTTTIEAIYEQGRLLLPRPLSLPERAHVRVTIESVLPLDVSQDSSKLEAELLRAATGPFIPYSTDLLHGACERVIQEKRDEVSA